MTKPGVWQVIVKKAFHGNKAIMHGNPNVITKAGVPGASDDAPVGTLCWDTTNSDAYISTVATGTWVKINA